VVDLASARPVWRAPESTIDAIRAALGSSWDFIHVTAPSVSDGDGGAASAEAVQAARGAEIYLGWGVPPEVVEAARGTLRWAHTAAAGAGASLTPAFAASGATLTNSREISAEPMAEWALVAIALCARGFIAAVAAQRECRWAKDAFTDTAGATREFRDLRVGIVGLGGVGRALARRCAALGMTVHGIRRRPEAEPPPGVGWVGGPEDLIRLAQQSDVLVIAAPHTTATRGLVDDAVLRALPNRSFVVNLARGALLDEAALRLHLATGHVAGAVLDVFAAEPLPADHTFWRHPRVLITPHVSAVSDRFWSRQTDLITDNIHRYLCGQPLRNIVDPEAGY
jgi:phosphoglycerate dehydrogenase-like enzyme